MLRYAQHDYPLIPKSRYFTVSTPHLNRMPAKSVETLITFFLTTHSMRFFPLLLAGLMGSSLAGWSQGLPGAQAETSKPPKRITILPVPVRLRPQVHGWWVPRAALENAAAHPLAA